MPPNFEQAEKHIRSFAGMKMLSGELNYHMVLGEILDYYEAKGIHLTSENIEQTTKWILQGWADRMNN